MQCSCYSDVVKILDKYMRKNLILVILQPTQPAILTELKFFCRYFAMVLITQVNFGAAPSALKNYKLLLS